MTRGVTDSHCHVWWDRFDEDRDLVLGRRPGPERVGALLRQVFTSRQGHQRDPGLFGRGRGCEALLREDRTDDRDEFRIPRELAHRFGRLRGIPFTVPYDEPNLAPPRGRVERLEGGFEGRIGILRLDRLGLVVREEIGGEQDPAQTLLTVRSEVP